LGLKNGPHRRPQNRVGAWASPINEPALPCRLLCGRILSGAPAHRGSTNPTLGAPLAVTSPLSRRFLPPETFHRCFPPLFPAEEPASRRSATINMVVSIPIRILRFYDTTIANRYVSWWYLNLVVSYSYLDRYHGIFSISIQRRYHTIPHLS
jgi:hypothetical protein